MISPNYAVELLKKTLEQYTPSRSEASVANMIKDKCANELGFELADIDSAGAKAGRPSIVGPSHPYWQCSVNP